MSGKYPARVGVTQFIPGHAVGRLQDVPYFHGLPTSEYSIASALRDAGYQTWHVGKWHLGGTATAPERHGFDLPGDRRLPARPERHRDGVSLVTLFRGGSSLAREALFWHYPHYANQGGRPAGAVRRGDWKLIEHFEDNRLELFNLRDDESEEINLAHAQPDLVHELHALLQAWQREIEALIPKPNPYHKPSPLESGVDPLKSESRRCVVARIGRRGFAGHGARPLRRIAPTPPWLGGGHRAGRRRVHWTRRHSDAAPLGRGRPGYGAPRCTRPPAAAPAGCRPPAMGVSR